MGQSFEIEVDLEDYNAIIACSSTGELSHSGLYK